MSVCWVFKRFSLTVIEILDILYITPTQYISAISCQEQATLQRDDNDVNFILDKHAQLDVYSAT